MESSRKLLLPGILSCLAMLAPAVVHGDEIRWLTDLNAALREAAEHNRPILLDVYKVPCPPCKYLDEVVYRDPTVVKFISDYFVALKINGELNEVRIKDNAKISRYPTLVFLTADQQILDVREGRLDVGPFLELSKTTLAALELSRKKTLAAEPPPKKNSPSWVTQVRTGPTGDALSLWATTGKANFPPIIANFSFQALGPREERTQRAGEILGQAVEAYRKEQWLVSLDQSRSLVTFYPDLPESTEGRQLEQMIGPERLERLEKELVENLAQVYWELAQAKLRQNQISQATIYMERIVRACPGSRYVPAAQEFLRNRSGGRTTAEMHASHGQP